MAVTTHFENFFQSALNFGPSQPTLKIKKSKQVVTVDNNAVRRKIVYGPVDIVKTLKYN